MNDCIVFYQCFIVLFGFVELFVSLEKLKQIITPASTPNMKLKISKESMWFGHKPMWEKIVPPTGKIVKRGNHSDSIILIIG